MAEKPSIHKLNLSLSNLDTNVFGDYNLTIALHPSETIERMMVRILAFCFRAAENLTFTRGLSATEEPDLWLKHDNGTILEWIEVGQPSPERLKKGASQSSAVKVFSYGRGLEVWWKSNGATINSFPKVEIHFFDADEMQALTELAEKTMNLTVTITESIAYISNSKVDVVINMHDMDSL